MSPERKTEIKSHIITEYYWNGKFVVYVDNYLTPETFENACERIAQENK